MQSFHAFVHAEIFGVPLPIDLEINRDARATVDVLLCQPTSALSPTGLAAIAPSQQVCETEPTDPALAGIEAVSGVLLGVSTWAGCGTGVEGRQEHGHMDVSDYENPFTENSHWVRADSDGNEQPIDTEAVSDLTLVVERDSDGRVTSWSGVGSATLRATAQFTQFDREKGRASCHGQASAFIGASLSGTDSSSLTGYRLHRPVRVRG